MEKCCLKLAVGDYQLGVHGEGFSCMFTPGGGLDSLRYHGREWLYRPAQPAFWRATTDNDRGNRFHIRSGMWLAADQFLPCTRTEVLLDGVPVAHLAPDNNRYSGDLTGQCAEIRCTYTTITVPGTDVTVTYRVTPEGAVTVRVHFAGKPGLPELPVFGLRMVMPTKAMGFRYQGLSGETYPDRKLGGVPGVYEVEGLPVAHYLVPQDCGMHVETDWVEVFRNSTRNNADPNPGIFGIRVEALEKKFGFSCLPYTPQELENATHREELPPARRTVLTVCGAVRGVGGIDSWGSRPEVRISGEEDHEFSFRICPVTL